MFLQRCPCPVCRKYGHFAEDCPERVKKISRHSRDNIEVESRSSSKGFKKQIMSCYICQKKHKYKYCPSKQTYLMSNPCVVCKQIGHFQFECPNLLKVSEQFFFIFVPPKNFRNLAVLNCTAS